MLALVCAWSTQSVFAPYSILPPALTAGASGPSEAATAFRHLKTRTGSNPVTMKGRFNQFEAVIKGVTGSKNEDREAQHIGCALDGN